MLKNVILRTYAHFLIYHNVSWDSIIDEIKVSFESIFEHENFIGFASITSVIDEPSPSYLCCGPHSVIIYPYLQYF